MVFPVVMYGCEIWTVKKADRRKIGALLCCDSWGRKESDTTERLNWTELKIIADGNCSHEIKRRLLLGRKVMTKLDSILKSKDITLSAKVHLVSSVQFSRSVVSDSLWPHESQHTRPPCPSPTPRVHSDSHPSSQWCHPAISSSVVTFSSCPQSLPASKSFPMSQLFKWGSQSIGVSASASFPPKKSQGWSPSEWTGWISLQSKGLSRVLSNTTVQKHQFFGAQPSSQSNSHIPTWLLEKL